MTVTWDLTAPRHAVFGGDGGEGDFELLGIDYSTATFDMQVRTTPGDTGTPLISITNAAAGSDGILATYNAALVHPVTGLVVGGTLVRVQINQGLLQALPYAADDPAAPLELAYDLRVTPLYLPRRVLAQGKFIVMPGVTI
jgi:hypothetical protein